MYDLIIIGSGPAGLSAAVYAKRAMLDFIVAEKNYHGIGQIAESEQVDNYLGLYGERGYELGEKFREHAAALGTQFIEAEVIRVDRGSSGFSALLSDGSAPECKTIIYAAGAAHKKLRIAGEREFSGKGVSYCAACDGAFYKGKTVAVIGGGDTALGDAATLSGIAEKVYLIHRRSEFRANKALQKRVHETENIELITNASPIEIIGEKTVTSLKILHENSEMIIAASGIFIAVGITPNTAPISDLNILDENGFVIADESGITDIPGFFAAGDVRTKPFRQLITAAADGANCVKSAEEFLEGYGKKRRDMV